METTVHEDGSLDKIIVLETEDTTKNFLGIGTTSGWILNTKEVENTDKNKKWTVTYRKNFASSKDANLKLAASNDTLFRVSSRFDKKFRWFYTHLYYADTYHCINRMVLPPDNYVTQEDYAFIDRLPSEGTIISKADSLYLTELHKKIFDVYGIRAIYEAYYNLDVKLIKEGGLENRWIDTLQKHKENVFTYLVKKQDVKDDYMFSLMDSLGIPLPYTEIRKRYDELYKKEDAMLNFINHASEGKYTHKINMPWNVIRTNADSISNNQLFWNPPSLKFLLKDYTMYAEVRKINLWSIVVSAMVIVFTAYLFLRKRLI
ncbi:MAG: hypothetical protein JJE09_02230 [Bacteroidia bacterium]|nr:hypothetical protein [Bacteroidia bacterium]